MEEATSSSVLLVQNSVQIPDLMIALYGSRSRYTIVLR